ncbi:iron-containing alcohol dehydrogenase [Alcaligenes sp. HPC1271]|nr:iron-containing alcohol dehydrogenase [Alcaligenes sp. HPC1271]EKU30344.1 iron-containing alcohol dehydrogenase [Alcaligenes sp. HPC1271]
MAKLGMAKLVADKLIAQGINTAIFDQVQPNPTVGNVNAGLDALKAHGADLIVSLGGGSSHDCAKGVALVASNGGKIADYEGVDKSAKPQLPLLAINTTAGTASEMTRFTIITDETRHVKMAIIDRHITPFLSVNDSDLMEGMPASLTAATGMDALTHAVEAYVSTIATPITDACAVKVVELIAKYLPVAVREPHNKKAREQMAYAQFLAGMAFNNASLGYVHAMAHQLGGFYDLPHGVCNALLLPHVQAFNMQVAGERLNEIGKLLSDNNPDLKGLDVIAAIKKLADIVGIPKSLEELGVKREDFPVLADNALKDVCGATNPIQTDKKTIMGIFEEAFGVR